MDKDKKLTKSPENQRVVDLTAEIGIERLGIMTSQAWYDDPRGLLFSLARYKFVAKMLSGKKNVLEVGCGDAFHSRLVQQEVEKLSVTDHDPLFIEDINRRNPAKWKPVAFVHNMFDGPTPKTYDAIYLLDVLEHIDRKSESRFLKHILESLDDEGMLIVGMPSIQSQQYASEISKQGHVNCKSGEELRASLQPLCSQLMIFSMNDEVVHTGYFPMAHYLIAVACIKKHDGK
jgi:2-polyprenyl-3-methyl-5-hydroxy-6-metoxy-1,4-benzoquinol methylase